MRKCLIIFLSLFSMFLVISQANAVGIGGYVTGGVTKNNWTYSDEEFNREESDKSSMSKIGGGFILDTTVAEDSLFNYRLNLGFTNVKMTSDQLPDVSATDVHLYNSFGFGIIRTESYRFWVGPQFGFGIMLGEYDFPGPDNECNVLYASLGLIAGINIHAGETFSLGIDGGYRRNANIGFSDAAYNGSNFAGPGNEVFANISFIFRINEVYTR